jgi:hypothetical protein
MVFVLKEVPSYGICIKGGAVVGRHMVVGLKHLYTISAYHHKRCDIDSGSWRGVLDIIFCDKVCQ